MAMPDFVDAGFNVTGNPVGLKRFAGFMFRPVAEANAALPGTELMFDFNNIIPMPADVAATNFYDWTLDNWGFVWGAIDLDYRSEAHIVWFQFTTAWDFPTPVFEALLADFPALVFVGSAYEENHTFELAGEFNGDSDPGPRKTAYIPGGPDDNDHEMTPRIDCRGAGGIASASGLATPAGFSGLPAAAPFAAPIDDCVGRAIASDVRSAVTVRTGDQTDDVSVGTSIRNFNGICAFRHNSSAIGAAANTVVGTAANQRVAFIFYRMCAVYRAGCGFASRGSLNPVRPWP